MFAMMIVIIFFVLLFKDTSTTVIHNDLHVLSLRTSLPIGTGFGRAGWDPERVWISVVTGSSWEYPPYPPGTKPALWLRIPRSVMGCPSRSGLAGTFQLCSSASTSLSSESCP